MANKKKNNVEETEKTKKTNAKKNEIKKETPKKEEKVEIESPIKSGMSETTRGMIIGMLIMGLIAAVIILLILGKNDGSCKTDSGISAEEKANSSEAMQEFYTYFEKDEPTLIVFASSACGWCELQKPIVERIGEMYNLDYLFMDYLELENSEISTVISYLGIGGSTPTSTIVQNGKVLDAIEGMMEGKEYVEFLVDGGVLPSGSTYQDEENLIVVTYDKFQELLNGSDTSVVLFDLYAISSYACGDRCLEQRTVLNSIAKENNIPVYHLPIANTDSDFIENLGGWGYSTEDYEESQAVNIPLLMFVRNGKIIWHQTGNMTEDDIRTEMKNYNIIQ